jgi:hypothetical protein
MLGSLVFRVTNLYLAWWFLIWVLLFRVETSIIWSLFISSLIGELIFSCLKVSWSSDCESCILWSLRILTRGSLTYLWLVILQVIVYRWTSRVSSSLILLWCCAVYFTWLLLGVFYAIILWSRWLNDQIISLTMFIILDSYINCSCWCLIWGLILVCKCICF